MRYTSLLVIPTLACLAACAQPAQPSASQASAAPTADTTAQTADTSTPPVTPGPNGKSLDIAFRDGSVTLTQQAMAQLDGAARLYRDAKPEVMIVAGHATPIGPEFRNVMLSAQRAEAVKQGLVDRGVPATRLQVVADGSAVLVPGETPSPSAVVTWR